MKGHGCKYDRKKEQAIAALLTHRNIDEAAKFIGIAGCAVRLTIILACDVGPKRYPFCLMRAIPLNGCRAGQSIHGLPGSSKAKHLEPYRWKMLSSAAVRAAELPVLSRTAFSRREAASYVCPGCPTPSRHSASPEAVARATPRGRHFDSYG